MPTDDYIKRSELIEHFQNYNPNWGVIDKDTVLDDIRDFPAADVAPVRHAYWESAPGKMSRFCSGCWADEPYKFADENAKVYDYCPHCGAMMDKE